MGLDIDYAQFLFWYKEILKALIMILAGMLAYRFSVLNRMRENKIVRKQACTDPLTGGGNRYLFLKDIESLIAKGKKFALCYLDIDGFKQINDTMGHDAGDELLKIMYSILSNTLPKKGTAYRLGGDEFAVLLTDIDTTEDISNILDTIKVELTKPIIVENKNIILEYSLGVSIFPTDAKDKKELLSYADDAMYYIKEHGKNDYFFHNKVLKAKTDNKTKMENDLRAAYQKEQFDVEFQPRIDIKDTSKIYFEALVYWQHPTLGYLKAEYFINQAEEAGLIINIDEFVLRKCCNKLKELKSKGYDNVKIAVNMSNIHVRRTDLIERICSIVSEYSFNRGDIQAEFTDVINVNHIENYRNMIDRFKQVGIEVAITNIEIKYEVLSLLKELPIDEIKINVKYLDEPDKFNNAVIGDIINLSKDLKYNVTVTHIEEGEELKQILSHNDVDKIQGNYLFKRQKIDTLEKYIEKYEEYKKEIKNMIELSSRSK